MNEGICFSADLKCYKTLLCGGNFEELQVVGLLRDHTCNPHLLTQLSYQR
jgi:hypothetical protein